MRYFETVMKVRDYECDAQGIVNNANYLHYFEATRHDFMEECGIYFRDMTEQNIFPVVRNANLSYKNSLRGSERFVSRLSVERQGLKYFFRQEILRLPEKILCVRGLIEVVCIIGGRASRCEIFDEAFRDYIVAKD